MSEPPDMGIVGCVAGFFLCLGLLCFLLPETVAQWGIHLDVLNRERSRAILARFPRATRWSGRIVGSILIVVGIVLLLVAALGAE